MSGSAGLSQANLDLAKKNRSALSLNSVWGRGVSCLWIGLPVFITYSCAGSEGRHTIPYPGLSVTRLDCLAHSSTEHQPASALKGAMEKHTRLIAPYPTDQLGLSLSENGSANLCETVIMYQGPCRVITTVIQKIYRKKCVCVCVCLCVCAIFRLSNWFEKTQVENQTVLFECHKSDLKRRALSSSTSK